MKSHLLDELQNYRNKISFGMPGHKGKEFFPLSIDLDLTEISTTDNLLNPSGVIKDLQEEISRIYGSKHSFIINNGSTGALHTAIAAATKPGDEILIQRNAHKSIYNALVLSNLNPVYLNTIYDNKRALFFGIDEDELREKIKNNNIKVALLVSPNFYGGILKLRELIEILHENNITVIVDEAHGAHLYFSDLKKYSALSAGADFVINSTHKMIPSLTQTALLHIGTDKFSYREILKYINIYHSTSPSYLLMLSIEAGIKYMDEVGRDELKNRAMDLEKLKSDINYDLDLTHPSIIANDPMKFLFSIENMTGEEVVNKLLDRDIRLEMGDLYYALALISPINTSDEIEKFKDEILKLGKVTNKIIDTPMDFIKPEIVLSPSDAFYSDGELINYKDSDGKISKGIIAAYPPGIPLISFGERINKDIIYNIDKLLEAGIEVIGLYEGKVEVVKWVSL